MYRATHEWICDWCKHEKSYKSPGLPTGWCDLRVTWRLRGDHETQEKTAVSADFCSVDCKDKWLQKHNMGAK